MKRSNPHAKNHPIIAIGILLTLYLWLQPLAVQAKQASSSEPAPDEDTLTFGVYAHIRSTEILRKFAPLTCHRQTTSRLHPHLPPAAAFVATA